MGLFIKQHYEVGWTEAAAELAGLWQRGPAGSGRQQSTATKAAVLRSGCLLCSAEHGGIGAVQETIQSMRWLIQVWKPPVTHLVMPQLELGLGQTFIAGWINADTHFPIWKWGTTQAWLHRAQVLQTAVHHLQFQQCTIKVQNQGNSCRSALTTEFWASCMEEILLFADFLFLFFYHWHWSQANNFQCWAELPAEGGCSCSCSQQAQSKFLACLKEREWVHGAASCSPARDCCPWLQLLVPLDLG